MQFLNRLFGKKKPPTESTPPVGEPMTTAKVDFSFRIYWTKMTRTWSSAQRDAARQQVLPITEQADFDRNLIAKQYTVHLADIPENQHSGASLMALLDVLAALDAAEETEEQNNG